MSSDEDIRKLCVSITDFLRSQCAIREDLSPEDKESLLLAVECLQSVYGSEGQDLLSLRLPRALPDIFAQAAHPVKVKHRLEADSLKRMGNGSMATENYRDAEEAYTAAIALDQWNSIYYCNRAAARIHLQDYSGAISDSRRALSLSPDYAKAHAKMGQAYVLMEQPRRAARCFRQAALLEPENESYRNNLNVAERQATPNEPFEQLLAGLVPGSGPTPLFGLGQNLMRLVLTDVSVSPFERSDNEHSRREGRTDSDRHHRECPFKIGLSQQENAQTNQQDISASEVNNQQNGSATESSEPQNTSANGICNPQKDPTNGTRDQENSSTNGSHNQQNSSANETLKKQNDSVSKEQESPSDESGNHKDDSKDNRTNQQESAEGKKPDQQQGSNDTSKESSSNNDPPKADEEAKSKT